MFQNETPNSFYNANFKIDIAIASYLVGVYLLVCCIQKSGLTVWTGITRVNPASKFKNANNFFYELSNRHTVT